MSAKPNPTTKLGHVLTEVITVREGRSDRRGHYRGQCSCEYHLDGPTVESVVELFAGHLIKAIPERLRTR